MSEEQSPWLVVLFLGAVSGAIVGSLLTLILVWAL